MVGLLDIAPVGATVVVQGKAIDVQGVNAKGVALLLARFPALRALMSGRDVGISDLMEMGGDIVAAIIAAGCGQPGNAEYEAAAGRLSINDQADFVAEILRLTMPNGVGPFVEKVSKMGTVLGAQVSAPAGKVPDTKSPKALKR